MSEDEDLPKPDIPEINEETHHRILDYIAAREQAAQAKGEPLTRAEMSALLEEHNLKGIFAEHQPADRKLGDHADEDDKSTRLQ